MLLSLLQLPSKPTSPPVVGSKNAFNPCTSTHLFKNVDHQDASAGLSHIRWPPLSNPSGASTSQTGILLSLYRGQQQVLHLSILLHPYSDTATNTSIASHQWAPHTIEHMPRSPRPVSHHHSKHQAAHPHPCWAITPRTNLTSSAKCRFRCLACQNRGVPHHHTSPRRGNLPLWSLALCWMTLYCLHPEALKL